MKWICKMLQRMEAQGEDFESRLRALEGWRAETGRRGAEGFDARRSRAGGVVGGVVAVLLRVMGGG